MKSLREWAELSGVCAATARRLRLLAKVGRVDIIPGCRVAGWVLTKAEWMVCLSFQKPRGKRAKGD